MSYTKRNRESARRIEVKEPERSSQRGVLNRANRELNRILPVRLPEDKWEEIRQEANELGVGPSTLARIWILDSLRKAKGNNHNYGDNEK